MFIIAACAVGWVLVPDAQMPVFEPRAISAATFLPDASPCTWSGLGLVAQKAVRTCQPNGSSVERHDQSRHQMAWCWVRGRPGCAP